MLLPRLSQAQMFFRFSPNPAQSSSAHLPHISDFSFQLSVRHWQLANNSHNVRESGRTGPGHGNAMGVNGGMDGDVTASVTLPVPVGGSSGRWCWDIAAGIAGPVQIDCDCDAVAGGAVPGAESDADCCLAFQ